MSPTTKHSVGQPPQARPTRAQERDHHIELLKTIRSKTLGLRVLTDQYSRDVSVSFAEPLAKIDRALSALLLERELAGDEAPS